MGWPCDTHTYPMLNGDEVFLTISGGHGPQPNPDWLPGRFAGMIIEVTIFYTW